MKKPPKHEETAALLRAATSPAPSRRATAPARPADGIPCQDAEDVRAVLLGADAIARSFLYLLRSATDLVACLRLVEVRHWPRLLCLLDDERLRAEVRKHLGVQKLACCA